MKGNIPQEIFNMVLNYFNGDSTKTWSWLTAKNPALYYVSPMKMIKEGQAKKVLEFALKQMEFKI